MFLVASVSKLLGHPAPIQQTLRASVAKKSRIHLGRRSVPFGRRVGFQKDSSHSLGLSSNYKVLKGVAVQGCVKGGAGLVQPALQQAVSVEHASVVDRIETFQQHRLIFGDPEKFSQPDASSRFQKPDSATPAPSRFQVAQLGQVVNDLGQMVAGNSIGGTHFTQLEKLRLQGRIH
jgi:hypothetical protein